MLPWQSFVSFATSKVEKIKADICFALIEEHYYGNVLKRIKGACAQLIKGEGAFSALYNVTEGEYTRELALSCPVLGGRTLVLPMLLVFTSI